MITIDISTALFWYFLMNVIVVMVIWAFTDYRRKDFVFKADEEYIWHCAICTYVYIDSRDEHASRCPQCGSLNTRTACTVST